MLNVTLPFFFGMMLRFEKYSSNDELFIHLVRCISIRLATLVLTALSVITTVRCKYAEDEYESKTYRVYLPSTYLTFGKRKALSYTYLLNRRCATMPTSKIRTYAPSPPVGKTMSVRRFTSWPSSTWPLHSSRSWCKASVWGSASFVVKTLHFSLSCLTCLRAGWQWYTLR